MQVVEHRQSMGSCQGGLAGSAGRGIMPVSACTCGVDHAAHASRMAVAAAPSAGQEAWRRGDQGEPAHIANIR